MSDTDNSAPGLILYNLRGCPYCLRVKRHLARLGLDYSEIQVPRLRFRRTEVKRLSGQNKVPVIVDGERVVADSRVICDYLSERYGAGPTAQGGRTRAAPAG